jgi:hypothetical protein
LLDDETLTRGDRGSEWLRSSICLSLCAITL